MTKSTNARRIIAILIILCLSIGGGIAINEIWNMVDRKLHPLDYPKIIAAASDEFNVPEYIIYATIKVESNFDPMAVSSAGAIGLMQMMPSTFEWLTGDAHLAENLSTKKLDDPEVSIRYGTYYLDRQRRCNDREVHRNCCRIQACKTWCSYSYQGRKGYLG